MSLTAIAFWVVLLLLAGYAVVLYNGLVRLKHAVGKAWANIDVLLKQRHDELPKLVEACKQYMQHERATLERVIAARNAVASARERADVNALGKAESGQVHPHLASWVRLCKEWLGELFDFAVSV